MIFLKKFTLKNANKKYQDRVIAPSETIKKFEPKLNSHGLNILDNLFRIDNGRLNIPIYFSLCGENAKKTIGIKKQMGKGTTKNQAKASALMELAERFSLFSFYKKSENFIIDSWNNIKHNLIPFETIAKSVSSNADDLDIAEQIFKSLPLKWVSSYDIFNDKTVGIPFDWFYNINEFNGSSSGNCLEEAICQGICEIIERHVSSLISEKKVRTRLININSIKNHNILKILNNYVSLNINIYITDFTLEMGIPSIGILAYDKSTFPINSEIVWTCGTSTDPNKAITRALTEIAQLSGDFNSGSNYLESGLPKFDFIDEANFVVDFNNSINIPELPDLSNNNIKIEIKNCVNALNNLGKNTFIVDITNPIIKIPTTYNIISGMHFRERTKKNSICFFLAKLISDNFAPHIAIKHLRKMKKKMKKKHFLYFYIAQSYAKAKKYDTAISNFYKALSLTYNVKEKLFVYLNIAAVFKDIGKYQKSLEILSLAETIDNKRVDIHNLKGYCYFMLEKYKMSIKSFQKISILDPGSSINYSNMSMNYKKLENKQKEIYYKKLANQ